MKMLSHSFEKGCENISNGREPKLELIALKCVGSLIAKQFQLLPLIWFSMSSRTVFVLVEKPWRNFKVGASNDKS